MKEKLVALLVVSFIVASAFGAMSLSATKVDAAEASHINVSTHTLDNDYFFSGDRYYIVATIAITGNSHLPASAFLDKPITLWCKLRSEGDWHLLATVKTWSEFTSNLAVDGGSYYGIISYYSTIPAKSFYIQARFAGDSDLAASIGTSSLNVLQNDYGDDDVTPSSIPQNGAAILPAGAAAAGAATAVAVVGGLGAVAAAAGMMADSRKKDDDDDDQGPIGYILQITKDQLLVAPDQPDSFDAAVYQVNSDGGYKIAVGASMSVESGGGVAVSPDGTINAPEQTFTVSQTDAAAKGSVTFALTASADGATVSKEITVEFAELDARPTKLQLLAFPDEKVGKADAPKTAEVRLTLNKARGGDWLFELAPSKDDAEEAAEIVTVSEPKVEGTQATFTIAVADAIERPTTVVGSNASRRFVTLHSAASLQTQRIEGPDVRVGVCFEGLYVDEIYTVNEQGEYKTGKTQVELQVDNPAEDKHSTAKVKFVAMVWDGNDVRDETKMQGASKVVRELYFDDPKCSDEGVAATAAAIGAATGVAPFGAIAGAAIWTGIFANAELKWTYNADPADPHPGTWSVALDKMLPGHGELVRGKVPVSSEPEDVMSMDLPIVLQLGQLKDRATMQIDVEREHCTRMIDRCIPKDQRQPLKEQLDRLQYTGALDYRAFAVKIYDTAWRIMVIDQMDYQFWDNGWGRYLFISAEIAEAAGNFVFPLLVGYWAANAAFATGNPEVAFVVNAIGPTLKDEALAFYAYYVGHDGARRGIKEIGDEYIADNWSRLLQEGAMIGVDSYFLKDFNIKNIIADPSRKLLKPLALFWIWKFTVHLEEDYVDGAFMGFVEALWQATKDILGVTAFSLIQGFVNAHGAASNLAASVQAKGWLGPAAPITGPAAETPPPNGEPTPPEPGAGAEPTPGGAETTPPKGEPPSGAGAETTPGGAETTPPKGEPPSGAGAETTPPKGEPTPPEPGAGAETTPGGAEPTPPKGEPPSGAGAETTPPKGEPPSGAGAETTPPKGEPPSGAGAEITDPTFIQTATKSDAARLLKNDQDNLEKACNDHDVILVMKVGDTYGQIAMGNALQKPVWLKPNTIDQNDRAMGFGSSDNDLGLVALKEPPPRIPLIPKENLPDMTPEEYEKYQQEYEKYQQRWIDQNWQFNDRKPEVLQLEKQGMVIWDRDTGIIYSVTSKGERGLAYGGDNDAVAAVDRNTGLLLQPGDPRRDAFFKQVNEKAGGQHEDLLTWKTEEGEHPEEDQRTLQKQLNKLPKEKLTAFVEDPPGSGHYSWKTWYYLTTCKKIVKK